MTSDRIKGSLSFPFVMASIIPDQVVADVKRLCSFNGGRDFLLTDQQLDRLRSIKQIYIWNMYISDVTSVWGQASVSVTHEFSRLCSDINNAADAEFQIDSKTLHDYFNAADRHYFIILCCLDFLSSSDARMWDAARPNVIGVAHWLSPDFEAAARDPAQFFLNWFNQSLDAMPTFRAFYLNDDSTQDQFAEVTPVGIVPFSSQVSQGDNPFSPFSEKQLFYDDETQFDPDVTNEVEILQSEPSTIVDNVSAGNSEWSEKHRRIFLSVRRRMSDCLKQKKSKEDADSKDIIQAQLQNVGSAAIQILQLLSLGRIHDYKTVLKTESGPTLLAVIAYADMIESSKDGIEKALLTEQQTTKTLTTQIARILSDIQQFAPALFQQSSAINETSTIFGDDISDLRVKHIQESESVIQKSTGRNLVLQRYQDEEARKPRFNPVDKTSVLNMSSTFSRDLKSYTKLADALKEAQISNKDVHRSIKTVDGVIDVSVKPRKK